MSRKDLTSYSKRKMKESLTKLIENLPEFCLTVIDQIEGLSRKDFDHIQKELGSSVQTKTGSKLTN